ncbi:peptidoglycan-binding domain-containing protein [Acidimangrovimonas pyrenivorans]|uniref:Peptidoglycan-binding domain-containing protein n=1 Tax=Acidimangrovimonas pyrenivorans TaxID=2030798 RepID=A0ABV7AKX4_9RHOB
MFPKRIATSCLLAALAVSPAQKVAAGGGDAIVGGVIGGIIGGAIVNEANKNKQRRTTTRSTTYYSAARAQNREVQVALNYFGFPAGTPDGVLGHRSRAAIADYQAFLGYPATGHLTVYERDVLVTSYHRGIAGGALTTQQAAANPMGMRGVLLSYRDDMAGMPAQPNLGMGDEMASAPQTVDPFAAPETGASTQVAEPSPAPEPAAPVRSGLPNFMASSRQASLASHCNKVSLQTSSNGGFTTAATMTDADFALNEQFCLARTYAISQGEDLAAKVQGFTPQQIAEQCNSFGPAMKDEIAALSLKPRDEVLRMVSDFAQGTGMAPDQLAATAKICLSVGYRTDNMDVAIGSALLLSALGDAAYSELLGHHLAEGFGAARRPDLALAWYQQALDALGSGARAAFVPGQPDRAELIRKAAYMAAGKPGASAAPAKLPAFGMPKTQKVATDPAADPATGATAVPAME